MLKSLAAVFIDKVIKKIMKFNFDKMQHRADYGIIVFTGIKRYHKRKENPMTFLSPRPRFISTFTFGLSRELVSVLSIYVHLLCLGILVCT